jgi:hypothetical protein
MLKSQLILWMRNQPLLQSSLLAMSMQIEVSMWNECGMYDSLRMKVSGNIPKPIMGIRKELENKN